MNNLLAFLFVSLVAPTTFACINLQGVYPDCRVSSQFEEKVTFSVSQKIQKSEVVYVVDLNYKEQPLSLEVLTDGNTYPVQIRGIQEPLPINLVYKSTCDQNSVIIIVAPESLVGATAYEKIYLSKNADGSLNIVDQTLLLGQVTKETQFTCKKL